MKIIIGWRLKKEATRAGQPEAGGFLFLKKEETKEKPSDAMMIAPYAGYFCSTPNSFHIAGSSVT